MREKFSFEFRLILLSALPTSTFFVFALALMAYAEVSIWLILLALLIGVIWIVYTNYRIHRSVGYQFRSLSNLMNAMIQGDYSLRASSYPGRGGLSDLIASINGLATRLSHQRRDSVESQLLARTVIEHIDVAIVALTEDNEIGFLNPAARRLLQLNEGQSDSGLLGQLAFAQTFSSGRHQVVELSLGNQHGRFNIHVEEFRGGGRQHRLLFITDVRTLLRSEERKAWQSLVRVISHEINNSLSPIISIIQTLGRSIDDQSKSIEGNTDISKGLAIVAERAKGLRHFVDSYKQLTRLPDPNRAKTSIRRLVLKIKELFNEQSIIIVSRDDVELLIDPVQFEQVLINLITNSVEAMAQSNRMGVISIDWHTRSSFFKLEILDQGGGISNPHNLFVPFYSTKRRGSGIGLVLCRQIVEAHGGQLTVANRSDSQGCCATIEIPLDGAKS